MFERNQTTWNDGLNRQDSSVGMWWKSKHWFFWDGAWAPNTQGTPDARCIWLRTHSPRGRIRDGGVGCDGRVGAGTCQKPAGGDSASCGKSQASLSNAALHDMTGHLSWLSEPAESDFCPSQPWVPKLGLAPFMERRWVPHTDPSGAPEDRGGPSTNKLAWAEVSLSAELASWTGVSWPRTICQLLSSSAGVRWAVPSSSLGCWQGSEVPTGLVSFFVFPQPLIVYYV